jgi:hypothetical protein
MCCRPCMRSKGPQRMRCSSHMPRNTPCCMLPIMHQPPPTPPPLAHDKRAAAQQPMPHLFAVATKVTALRSKGRPRYVSVKAWFCSGSSTSSRAAAGSPLQKQQQQQQVSFSQDDNMATTSNLTTAHRRGPGHKLGQPLWYARVFGGGGRRAHNTSRALAIAYIDS